MRVVFRSDASNALGTGHVMRCLSLSSALEEHAVETAFVCRDVPGNLIEHLRTQGKRVLTIPDAPVEDARRTIEALRGDRPDWLVVDHYQLDARWEREVRPHVGKLLVIDDLADRVHACDVLLDQTFVAGMEQRYVELVPDTCVLLLGPRFALLRPEFAALHERSTARDGCVRRILVFFGGSDGASMTTLAVEALTDQRFEEIDVDVIVGANNANRERVIELAQRRPRTTVHGPLRDLANLLAGADLALGAGGTTTWERCCLGLPAVVVITAENQRPSSNALADAGLICLVGDWRTIGRADLVRAMASCLDDSSTFAEMSVRDRLLVDGLGARRAAEAICPTEPERLSLRRANHTDVERFFHWANDPDVRRNAINTTPIPWATHRAWFDAKLADPRCLMFVLLADGLPVGQIRFDRERDEAEIDYSLDPVVRGRGWGARLVAIGMRQDGVPPILSASVKTNNHASRAVFVGLGFERVGTSHQETIEMLRHCAVSPSLASGDDR